jgi:hypothetical protein
VRIARRLGLLCGLAVSAHAADLAVTAIDSPQSGCMLGSTNNVTIRVFNYGATLPAATSFNVSYMINAGSPTTELVTLAAPLSSNTAFGYTFTTQANLFVPGTYTFNAGVGIAGDVSPANDTYSGYTVVNNAASVGGSTSGPTGATLSGTVTLSDNSGDVREWQQSSDGGLRWRRLENTTTQQAFAELRADTLFRALVQNGSCAPALSSALLVQSSDPIFYSGFEP